MAPANRTALEAAVVVATFFSNGASGESVSGGLLMVFAVDSDSVGVFVISVGIGFANIGLSFNGLIIPGLEANGKMFSTVSSVNVGAGKISKIIGKVEDVIAGVDVAEIGRVDEEVELAISIGIDKILPTPPPPPELAGAATGCGLGVKIIGHDFPKSAGTACLVPNQSI